MISNGIPHNPNKRRLRGIEQNGLQRAEWSESAADASQGRGEIRYRRNCILV